MSSETELACITKSIEQIEKDIALLLKITQGDNGDGLVTRVALTEQSIRRMWWWVGGTSLILTSAIVKLMFSLGAALATLPK